MVYAPSYSLQPGATSMSQEQQYLYGESCVHRPQQQMAQPAHQDQPQRSTSQPYIYSPQQPTTEVQQPAAQGRQQYAPERQEQCRHPAPMAEPERPDPPRLPNIPKSLIYDGKGNWQTFYSKYIKLSNMHRWSRTERRDQLRRCLEGEAIMYYSAVLKETMSFRDLITKMEHRFGTKDSPKKAVNVPETAVNLPETAVNLPETADILFNTAEQEADESLDEWADRVQTLAITVYSALPEDYIAKQCALRFCRGAQKREAGGNCGTRTSSKTGGSTRQTEVGYIQTQYTCQGGSSPIS